jgi:hypothetical protein
MTYKASLDNVTKAITIGVTILPATIIIGQYSIIKDAIASATPIYTTLGLLIFYCFYF